MLPTFDFESTELERLDGRPISYKPKKEKANATNTTANKIFSQALVEILLSMSELAGI